MGKSNYTTSITGHRSVSVRRAIYRRSSPKDCCERPQYRMGRATPPAPTDNISIYRNKPKILCLHGGGQLFSSFELQLKDLRDALPELDFVFAQTPEEDYVWIRDPPYGKEYPTTESEWASNSTRYLDEIVREQGPFYGILGYSQGAAMILVYLAYLQENNLPISFEKVILFNGYLPTTHQGLMASILKLDIEIPILNIVGGLDPFEKREQLSSNIKKLLTNLEITSIIDEMLEHYPPMMGYSSFQDTVKFIMN